MDARPQLVVERRDEPLRRRRFGFAFGQRAAHHRIAELRAAHRLDDIAGKRRMQIAEEADRAAIGAQIISTSTFDRLGDALGFHLVAVLVIGLEEAAIDLDLRCLRAPAPCSA